MFKRKAHGEVVQLPISTRRGPPVFSESTEFPLADKSRQFGYMFTDVTDDERLPASAATVAALKELGAVMKDAENGGADSNIPAAYTYFGQFVDHDITLEVGGLSEAQLAAKDLAPVGLGAITNGRNCFTELDSVYFDDLPRAGEKVVVGPVEPLKSIAPGFARPTGKSDQNDLPRQGPTSNKETDRAAMIGDPRNDENVIIAQLHTAFLKAHNALVDRHGSFEKAAREMTLRYQSIILDDYLKRICDPTVYGDVSQNGPKHWKPERNEAFMPAEFAFAAYRFGHSMVRTTYDYNLNFEATDIRALFVFTALSGQIGAEFNAGVDGKGFPTLPDNWIIEWERFISLPGKPASTQMASAIDTQLTSFLFQLRDTLGELAGENTDAQTKDVAPMLAKRNLLRGYAVSLPTGQAAARRLGFEPLQGETLLATLPESVREKAEPFADRTPLWFYILAESGNPARGNLAGNCLGPVGSTIILETFHNLIRHADISILDGTDHGDIRPTTLADMIMLAETQDQAM